MTRRNFFTLAEVLITLAVIGVVASLSIPSLMNNIQDQKFHTAYKKAYSDASNAWRKLAAESKLEARSGWVNNEADYNNFTQFMTEFNKTKICNPDTPTSYQACWADGGTIVGDPGPGNEDRCFVDTSGRAWCDNGRWGYFVVDVNGAQGPNLYGKDRYPFNTCVEGDSPSSSQQCNTAGVPGVIRPWINKASSIYCNIDQCDYTSWLYE